MGLDEYQRKRDFTRTPEPRGGQRASAQGRLRFVIQKHAARRLHYDFRLELDGSLKSWAVPKGPSLDPREKRLAVHVEDHPLEYRDFEGVIPTAQYGGGTVMVWDEGHWYPEGDPEAAYRRGRLRFRLEGKKLYGTWNLVRSGARGGDASRENWLLIKAHDEHSRDDVDVVQEAPLSVASGRTLEEIAAERDRVWRAKETEAAAKRPRRSRGARGALPALVAPQLATLVDAPPAGSEWLHEIKYDGYRILARLGDGAARLFSRNGKDWTARFPRIARALEELPLTDSWLDGELAYLRPDGRSSFQQLQGALAEGRDEPLVYVAFDLLFAAGEDLRGRPLLERKHRLAETLAAEGNDTADGPLRYSDHVVGHGEPFYRQACEYGLEGVVTKRADLPYRGGRSRDWLKVKCLQRQEFVIVGYTEPRGSRCHFGALLLGVHDAQGQLRYAGRVGTGFDQHTLSRLGRRLAALRSDAPALRNEALPAEAQRGVRWVRPALVAEVAFSDWTREGVLRHPSYQGLREDKPSADVVREQAAAAPGAPARAAAAPPPDVVAGVRLSKPDKVLFPDQGLTKRELAAYYEAIAEWILPQAADRPLTLLRCPDGRHRQCFYQKHAGESTPAALRRVNIAEKGKNAVYLALDSVAGLIALVQMGVLEIHVRGTRTDRLDHPDRLVFDFDPDEGQPWGAVVRAAQRMRGELAELGLESFVRTTGGKGLHVVMPMVRRHDWDQAKRFSRAVAERMARRYRGEYTVQASKAARRGKIFIDYLRNSSGATAVASYSTRARPHATVATPLSWEELEAGVDPVQFTVRSVPQRLRELRADPWADIARRRQSITRAARQALGLA